MAPKAPTAEDVEIGARVTALRKARGLTQKTLAEVVGVTFQQVQKYERGINRIGAGRLQAIARSLEVSISTLYGDEIETGEQPAILSLYGQPGAAELLMAFAKIENTELRRNVLAIVDTAVRISLRRPAVNG